MKSRKLKSLSFLLSLIFLLNLTFIATSALNVNNLNTYDYYTLNSADQEAIQLIKNGATSRQILAVYRDAGVISNDEFETLVAFDESILLKNASNYPSSILEDHESYYTYTKISWNKIFSGGTVTVAAIAGTIAKAAGVPSAIVITLAEFLYELWQDDLTLEGKGIEVKILWQWHYNDNEMQERWHPYYKGFEYYY